MMKLYFLDGKSFIWNSRDWFTLRTKYRICGQLIGAIAAYPRQNNFLGLPLELLPEEAAFLIENGVCQLVELSEITHLPSGEQKLKSDECNLRIRNEQVDTLKKRRIDQISQKIDIIVAGKKQKAALKGLSASDEILDKQALLQEEVNKVPPVNPAHILVHLPTEHIWPTVGKELTIHSIKPSVTSGLGRIRFEVYKDLWKKDHYLTSGTKFGGDFLVYPGDPVRFHATFIVFCLSSEETKLRPINLVALGRLAVAVNKMVVLATVGNSSDVHYQTIQWHESVNG